MFCHSVKTSCPATKKKVNETPKSHKMNQFHPWLGFKPVTVILFYSVLHMSGIYQRVSWKLNGCRSIFTLLQLLWSCFMNWTGMTLSGKTNKLNVLQNWKKSGTINSSIITQPHTVQLLLFSNVLCKYDRSCLTTFPNCHWEGSWKYIYTVQFKGPGEYFWQTSKCLDFYVVKHWLECISSQLNLKLLLGKKPKTKS